MLLVGLTGNIATGKSFAASIFRELGVPVLDGDSYGRNALQPWGGAYRKVLAEFGNGILASTDVTKTNNGSEPGLIDRRRLAAVVFENPEKKRRLERIVWPCIYWAMFTDLVKLFFRGHQYAVLELPMLFESGFIVKFLHATICMHCREEQQIERAIARDPTGLTSRAEVEARIRNQMPTATKIALATYSIDSSEDFEETRQQVIDTDSRIKRSRRHWLIRFCFISLFIFLACIILFFFESIRRMII